MGLLQQVRSSICSDQMRFSRCSDERIRWSDPSRRWMLQIYQILLFTSENLHCQARQGSRIVVKVESSEEFVSWVYVWFTVTSASGLNCPADQKLKWNTLLWGSFIKSLTKFQDWEQNNIFQGFVGSVLKFWVFQDVCEPCLSESHTYYCPLSKWRCHPKEWRKLREWET